MNYVEEQFTSQLLSKLGIDWIRGDQEAEYRKKKSVDIVHHSQKLAIEIKDDLGDELPPYGISHIRNLARLSNRYKEDIESANKKFRNYKGYESAVLIRYDSYGSDHIKYLLGGFYTLSPHGRVGNKEINISRHCESCSVFAFWHVRYKELMYYRNSLSERNSDAMCNILKNAFDNTHEITENELWSKNPTY